MGVYGGPDVSESGLVLALDGANYKSFKGEATTNLSRNSRDFSGTAYASSDEWVSSEPTRLTKTYISSIITPIGNGATLIQESGTAGYHHLSRWGGGGESGAHSLSCYVFPLTSDITDFVIGMLADGGNQISFNLNTREITYGSGISNRDAFITPVVGFDGWYRVGANIEGRGGGWVGCIGYTTSAVYTGTSGNKKCYITGIQYESKTTPTMFTEAQTTRGTTVATGGGWADLIGNGNNGELVNGVKENSANGGSLSFDGSDDYSSHPYSSLLDLGTQFTISSFIKFNNLSTLSPIFAAPNVNTGVFTEGYKFYYNTGTIYGMNTNTLRLQFGQNNWAWNIYASNGITITDNNWHFVSVTASNLNTSNPTITFYIDGNSITGTFWDAGSKAAIRYSSNINSPRVASIFYPTSYDGPYYFNGNIAQVSIYNRALSAAEVSQNFNALRGRYGI